MDNLRAIEIIENMPNQRIAVIGDLILDQYIWGEASRISPEAPVPVVHVTRRTSVLGGAANVINNLSCLKTDCRVYGIIGDDSDGVMLLQQLRESNCDCSGVISTDDRCTIVKTRILAGKQQVCRIDEEVVKPLPDSVEQALFNKIATDIEAGLIDGIIFEDYAKGLLNKKLVNKINELAIKNNILTAMDPHPSNKLNVPGLTFMTPNRLEAFAMTSIWYQEAIVPVEDDNSLFEVANALDESWKTDNLLITLGAEGMALFRHGQPFVHIHTKAKEVFDVSGAGDTVISTMMTAMLAGADAVEAAMVANNAAGVVVGHVGTVPIEYQDLIDSFKK